MVCSGNNLEYCGGSNRLDMYHRGPAVLETVDGFTSMGCYTEATNIRALSASLTAADGMTVGQCADFCSAYNYMGVEYSREW